MTQPPPPVVLLHGFPLGPGMWKGQIPALEAMKRRVLAPTLLGFGRDGTHGGATIEASAEAVLKEMRSQNATPAVIVGFSMGGYVALEMAHRAPEAVAGLVLVSTRAEADSPEVANVRKELAAIVEKEGARHLFGTMKEKILGPELPRQRPESVGTLEHLVRANTGPGISAVLRGLALRPDQRDRLPHLRMPTLVMHNEQDALIPVEGGRTLAKKIPGAKLVTMPGHAHLMNWEFEDAFNRVLLDWIAQLPSAKK